MRRLGYIMKYSLYKTLARKYNSSLRKIIRKYTKDKVFSIPYKDSKGNEKQRILTMMALNAKQ